MSWLGDLGALQDTLGSEGATLYARGAILNYGARNGYSANATLGMLRQAGVGFRRGDALAAFSQIRERIAAGQTSAALPVDATTGEILPGEPPADWTGKYVHQVTATFRTQEPSGKWSITEKTLGVLSNQPLSPGEAAAAAMDILTTPSLSNEEGESPDPSNMLSMQLTGAWYQIRPSRRAA